MIENQIKQLNKDIKDNLNKQAKQQILIITNKIVTALKSVTPVDTGRARAGWTSDDSAITNTVPYISELNNGTSKQAPKYFIEKTILMTESVQPNGVIVQLNP